MAPAHPPGAFDMESLLNRYRNITVLLLVIFAQLVLLAVQVKNDQDVRVIRIWTVTAVTPVARLIEGFRGGGLGFLKTYILLHDVNAENRRLQSELARYKLENIFLKNELNTADRAKALQVFQEHTQSKTVAASVILASAGSNSNVRFLDRGSFSGVQRGMAVVTPDGIVGKIIESYPSASEMLMVTDPDFAAGVVSQDGQVRGTLKGQGNPTLCKVDYVPFQEKIEPGALFFTSGDDRIFPRGFPVGVVKEVRNSQPFKEIYVEPSGIQHGAEDVLILLEGVHQEIPRTPPANQPVYVAPAPPPDPSAQTTDAQPAGPVTPGTEADKLRLQYKAIGEAQKHVYGEGAPGTKPPDFNIKLPNQPPGSPPASQPNAGTGQPAKPTGGVVQQPGGVAPRTGSQPEPARRPAATSEQPRTGRPPVQAPAGVVQLPGPPPAPAKHPAQQPATGTRPPAKAPGAAPPPPGGAESTTGTRPQPATPRPLVKPSGAVVSPGGAESKAGALPASGQQPVTAPARHANQAAGPGGLPPE